MKSLLRVLLVFTAGIVTASAAPEASPSVVAHRLVQQYSKAIVRVNLVLRISGSVAGQAMPPREIKNEVLATVISPDGLTVVSLAALDVSEQLDGMRINTPKGPAKIEVSGAEFKAVKIVLPDGGEREARVVLKDTDLDLAFIRPIDAGDVQYAFVDLTKEAKPDLLLTGYVLSRTARGLQGAPQVRRSDIVSLVQKPRVRIQPEIGVPSCPMFDEHGNVYGLCVRLMVNGKPSGIIVLPASEVAESARQAAAAKMPDPSQAAADAPAVETKPESAAPGAEAKK